MTDKAQAATANKVFELVHADADVLERLGISLKTTEPGRSELELIVSQSMTNSHGFCHGGFLFALADTAFAYALASVNASPVTLQATISFMSAVREGDVVRAIGEVSRNGRNAVFATAKLFNQQQTLIAEFQGAGFNVS